MMWVDVPQISLLSFFFCRKRRASTKKKLCQVPSQVGKFSSGFSLDVTHSSQPLRYKSARYRYGPGRGALAWVQASGFWGVPSS